MHKIVALASLSFLVCGAAPAQDPSQYSPDKQIYRGNVARLEQAWLYRTGEPVTPLPGRGKAPAFEATPVYADGLLYLGTPYGKAIALDAETGKERWSFDAGIDRKGNYGDFANRGGSRWVDPDAAAGERAGGSDVLRGAKREAVHRDRGRRARRGILEAR